MLRDTNHSPLAGHTDIMWDRLFAISTTAALLVLAYPPVGMGWMAYIALVPYLRALHRTRTWPRMVRLSTGLSFVWVMGLMYFTWTMRVATGPERLGAFLAVSMMMWGQVSLFSWGAWRLLHWSSGTETFAGTRVCATAQVARSLVLVITLALLWMGVEWLIQRLGFGLSCYLGLTQWRYPRVVHLARWGGLMGVSALVAAINALIYLVTYPMRPLGRYTTRLRMVGTLVVLSVLVVGARYGALRPSGVWPTGREVQEPTGAYNQQVRLALIQSSIDLSAYERANTDRAQLWRLFQKLVAQTRQAVTSLNTMTEQSGPLLVLWPETVLHEPILSYQEYTTVLTQLNREANAWLLAGLPWHDGLNYYNSAILLNPHGAISGHYSKVRPIPIAEAWATRGPGWFPMLMDGIQVGVGLCSELIDPLPSGALTRNGAQVLVFLSSLDYMSHTAAPGLQGAFAPFRAAETGRYVAQVGSIGLTLVATPAGTIEAVLPEGKPDHLAVNVPALSGATPYIRWGDTPAITALLVSLLAQVCLKVSHRRVS